MTAGASALLSSAAATPRFCLAAAAGDSQVNLTWTSSVPARAVRAGSVPASNFTFYEGTAPGIGKPVTPGTVTNSSALVTGLTNGTTYYFWLAVGQASTAVSSTAVATPGASLKVRTYKFCLSAVAGDSQVNLTWIPRAPGNNFTIYEGTAPGIGKPVTPGTVTDSGALVTGLTNGTTYYFWLTVGRATTAVSNTTSATPVTVPGAPTGLTATRGNAQVTLSWTAPASTGGLPVSGYLIYEGTSPGGETGTPVNGSAVTGTGYTAVGLTNGTTYYFRVIAVNAAGQGPLSAETPATLLRIMPTSPPPSTPTSGTTTPSVTPRTSPATTAQKVSAPKWLITLLTAAAAIVVAGALALIRRRFRSRRPAHSARAREQIAIAQDVRAVPDKARPDIVSVHDTGREPTHTVRLEPHPGTITTTIKEGRP